MPQITKRVLSQFIGSGCAWEVAIQLYPGNAPFKPQRQAHTMPEPQPPRPGIVQVTEAGEEWQAEKLHDLTQTFGAGAVVGQRTTNAAGQVRYSAQPLQNAIAHATPVRFLVEAEFAIGPAFHSALGI